ncbi:MAG: hypothetical protein K8R59_02910 [Thermoanaerobaculales bacterium]|nr:hypothetical protein [Thermoanaerobaculales bacterium]
MSFPFEIQWDQDADQESFIDSVVESLRPQTLVLPKGPGFVPYTRFQEAYEVLKSHTAGCQDLSGERCWAAVEENGLALVVLRCIAGLSPPELARLTSTHRGVAVDQGFARNWDRKLREEGIQNRRLSSLTLKRLRAMVETASRIIDEGAPQDCPQELIHRLDKADTQYGFESTHHLAMHGAPYCVVLYERFLGRPFASHRDAVSELIGDIMENAIEDVLTRAKISFRKTKRAERVPGFDQAPDFFVPDEFSPKAVIEAKITEDDGTARDKVTRVQHLAQIAAEGERSDRKAFQVIACIDGAGFAVRRSNLEKILRATSGKTFTLKTLDRMVECTVLRDLRPRG